MPEPDIKLALPNTGPSAWAGITPELALELETRICRCRARVDQFGGGADDARAANVRAGGPPAAAWLVVRATLDFIRGTRLPNSPTNKSLCELIGVGPGPFGSKLLEGALTSQPAESLMTSARTVFRYLLIGRDETPHDNAQEGVMRRVHEFFFRGLDQNPTPPFFERDRLPFGEPCSVTEIRNEISWLIRKFERTKRPAALVWATGGLSLFDHDMMGPVGGVTAEAMKAGVDVSFVFTSEASNTDAVHNLASFEGRYGPITKNKFDLKLLRRDGDTLANPVRLHECLHPTIRKLYLSIPNADGTTDDTLYLLRAPFTHGEKRRLPLALRANATELDDFKLWLQFLRNTKLDATANPG